MSDRPYIPPVRIGTSRDARENRFYLGLHPCPGCGTRDGVVSRDGGSLRQNVVTSSGRIAYESGSPLYERYDLVCPACQYRRNLEFLTHEDHLARAPSRSSYGSIIDIGGPMPSTIIGPHEFVAELLRCLPKVDTNFHIDDRNEDGFSEREIHLHRVETCIVELRKFLPPETLVIPSKYFTTDAACAAHAAHAERFTRTSLDEQHTVAQQLRACFDAEVDRRSREVAAKLEHTLASAPKVAPLQSGTLALHHRWLNGWPGGQQLEIRNTEFTREQVQGENMSRAVFEKVVLDHGNFDRTTLKSAALVDVRAHYTSFRSASFSEATLLRCSFARAWMNEAHFGDAVLVESDLCNGELKWSRWHRAEVTRCSFVGAQLHNAALDHATFTDCDFRDADFTVLRNHQCGTSFDTTFVRCDLRGSSWMERPLYRVKFIDCKFHDVRGTPYCSEMVIERPDLSEAGDGSRICTDRDAYLAWGIDPDVPRQRYSGRTWVLSIEERAAAITILDSRGIPFEETVLANPPRHAISIRDPDANPAGPQITAALAAITERNQIAAIQQSRHVLVQQLIDKSLDNRASFEETLDALLKRGFDRDESTLAISQSHTHSHRRTSRATATSDDLLRACLAEPDNDEPRLVWADSIGGERGEFVVIQCELANWSRSRSPSEAGALRRRERELLARYGGAWAGLEGIATKYSFRRGFVDAAEIDTEVFMLQRQRIFSAAPLLLSLTATGLTGHISYSRSERRSGPDAIPLLTALFAHPGFQRLHGLHIKDPGTILESTSDSRSDDFVSSATAALDLAIGAGALRQLRAFGADGSSTDRSALAAELVNVERLWLTPSLPPGSLPKCTATGIIYREEIPLHRGLVECTVDDLGDAGLVELAASPIAETIERLRMTGSKRIDDPAPLARFPRLRELTIGCPMGAANAWEYRVPEVAMQRLAETPMPALRVLEFHRAPSHAGMAVVVKAFGQQLDHVYGSSFLEGELRWEIAGSFFVSGEETYHDRSLLHVGS